MNIIYTLYNKLQLGNLIFIKEMLGVKSNIVSRKMPSIVMVRSNISFANALHAKNVIKCTLF